MSYTVVNPYAKALSSKLFALKTVNPKRGKGSYRRKNRGNNSCE